MQKYFVLDTNVLIHNPQALYSFTDNIVIIPITVIEELDRFKTSADKKGMHARQVLREIDGLLKKGALKKGAKMENGGVLMIHLGTGNVKIPDLDDELNDNRILGVAWELLQQKKQVFFISKDVNARIKAEAAGIPARDYEKQVVEYGTLYRGWKELSFKSEDIEILHQDNEFKYKAEAFLPCFCQSHHFFHQSLLRVLNPKTLGDIKQA